MKRNLILLLLLFTTILFTGCWDYFELNNVSIVSGVALDKTKDNKILLTLLIPAIKTVNSQNNGDSLISKEQLLVVSAEGDGILTAYNEVQKKLSRKIFLSQIEAIVIGETLAKDGVSNLLDFFSRYIESNSQANLYFTKGKASDIFDISSKQERNLLIELHKRTDSNREINISLIDFLNTLTEKGMEPIASQLVKIPLNENTEFPSSDVCVAIYGTAIFYKDKLIGWLNEDDTKALRWLLNEIKHDTLKLDIFDGKNNAIISSQTNKINTKITPIINNNELEFQVTINTELNIYENSSELDLSNPKNIHYIEKLFSETIKKNIQSIIKKAQKQFNSDILRFGKEVYIKYPNEWNTNYKDNWQDIFPNVKIDITCHVNIPRIGNDAKSLTKPSE
jgi:spore germination protein KC